MGAMAKAPPVLARVYRGTRVESAHRGSVAVVDERGALLAWCGDPSGAGLRALGREAVPGDAPAHGRAERRRSAWPTRRSRSCARPTAASRGTRSWPRRCSKRAASPISDLDCGAHLPMHEPSARALIAAREAAPTALHNNCSGKHAGMLLACRLLELPAAGYTDPAHALQRRIRTLLARYAGVPESEITVAVDGCNLPVFRLPLSALAGAYARLLRLGVPGEEPAGAAARARIVRAHGATARDGRRSGALHDGLPCAPAEAGGSERRGPRASTASASRRRARPAGPGVAFKIEDGSARPRDAVTLEAAREARPAARTRAPCARAPTPSR